MNYLTTELESELGQTTRARTEVDVICDYSRKIIRDDDRRSENHDNIR